MLLIYCNPITNHCQIQCFLIDKNVDNQLYMLIILAISVTQFVWYFDAPVVKITVSLWIPLGFGVSCIIPCPPRALYMRQWTGSASVQLVNCRLFGTKPLPELMLIYCQFGWTLRNEHQWNTNWKILNFSFMEMPLKISSAKCQPFCPGRDERKDIPPDLILHVLFAISRLLISDFRVGIRLEVCH